MPFCEECGREVDQVFTHNGDDLCASCYDDIRWDKEAEWDGVVDDPLDDGLDYD